jgi:DNA-binding LacI/PurR family transcriptional regulator
MVAEESGVSIQTVSRVLNNHPDVAHATAERIQKVMHRLHYTPNAIARSLIQQRSYTIGVAIDAIEWSGPSRILAGINYEAEEQGYCLLIKRIQEEDTRNVEPLLQTMLSRQVDGVIWGVPEIGDNHRWVKETCVGLGVPIVFLSVPEREDIPSVSMNEHQGGRMATRHLLEAGYQHIAHIAGPEISWEAQERKRGWLDVLAEVGLNPLLTQQLRWADKAWSPESSGECFLELLESYPEMDAVFVASDQMALKVLQIASQKGIQIPDQLGVMGYDNIPESSFYWPSLSTIDHDHVKLGAEAVGKLLKIIDSADSADNDEAQKATVLAPQLIIRRSTTVE